MTDSNKTLNDGSYDERAGRDARECRSGPRR